MHERISVERIADLDVAVNRSLHANRRSRQLRKVDLDRVRIAIGFAAKTDLRRSRSPARLFHVFEAARLKRVDDGARDRDRPLPFRRAIAILDARATPAKAQLALVVAQLLLQVEL